CCRDQIEGKCRMKVVGKIDRRTFVCSGLTAGAGLLLGFAVPETTRLSGQEASEGSRGKRKPNPAAFIHIGADDTVTFLITKPEMGQGTVTSLSMLLAEELDCDWKHVRTQFAPVDPSLYGMQGVYGSSSIRT